MNVDAIIAEATQEVADEQTAAPQEVVASSEIQDTSEETQEKEDLSKKSDDELTPEQLAKRIKNRESHQNSKLAEMRRQLKEAKAEKARLEQLVQTQSKPQQVESGKPVKPQLEQFETFEQYEQAKDDYYEALADWKTEQKFKEQNKQTQEAQINQEYVKWVDERSQLVDNRVVELASAIPDFEETIEEIEDIIPELTPELAKVALEADDINLAAYTLFKEGKLAEVLRLPPSMIAKEIAKAEIRGAAFLNKPKPTSNAPAPISPSRGNAIGSKSIEKMDGISLLKSLR